MPADFPGTTVVIPCFNAGARVLPVVSAALEVAAQVIVVDDGSTDGCLDAVAALPVELLRFSENRGKGHALLQGIQRALEDHTVTAIALLDADGQHDPRDLPRLLQVFARERADLLIGTRVFSGEIPWASRFGNRATVRVTAWLLGRRLPDTQCGYRVLSRAFAQAVLREVSGGRYETEMEMIVLAVRGQWRIAEAPIPTIYEPGNRSSHFRKLSDSWRIYARLWRATRPQR